MLLWSRAVAPRLDPYTTVHLDRLTAEGFAELGVQFGHDDLGSLEGSMFYRLSEFTFVLMFLNFMNYLVNYFTILNCIIGLNFDYELLGISSPLHSTGGLYTSLCVLTRHLVVIL